MIETPKTIEFEISCAKGQRQIIWNKHSLLYSSSFDYHIKKSGNTMMIQLRISSIRIKDYY